MKNAIITILIVVILAAGAYWYFVSQNDNNNGNNGDQNGDKDDLIVLDQPQPNDIVSSPLTITGEARGGWYFEATFPVKILDANGILLGQHFATAQGEWMTENLVPFEAELSFSDPVTETGTLVLEKANPSGLPENADQLRIPVRFELSGDEESRTIQLYYYNSDLDEDEDGNILCSRQGLVAVEREIPITQTPIQDTIRLLLKGELTSSEKAQGISSEYPLDGFELEGASVNNGVLTLAFDDPNSETTGGSCRTGILWFQIEQTALQFDGINEVKFQPDTLFQP